VCINITGYTLFDLDKSFSETTQKHLTIIKSYLSDGQSFKSVDFYLNDSRKKSFSIAYSTQVL